MESEKIRAFIARFLKNKSMAIAALAGCFCLILGGTVALTAILFRGSDEPENPGPVISESTVSTAGTMGYGEIIDTMNAYISEYQQQKILKVTAGGCSVELNAARASAPVDYDDLRFFIAEKGEDPDLVADYRTVASAMNIAEPTLNTEYITQSLGKLQQALDPGGDGWYEIRTSSVVVHRGRNHLAFDKDEAAALVTEAFNNKNYKEITLEVSETKPADPDWDQLYADFCIEPVNARYDVDENGRTFVVESVKGRGIDLEVVKESYRTGNWEKKSFLGFAISPEITTADIDTNLFQDVLGTKTTTYDPSELSRSHNVELAAASIDGCIILPGYKFSFNNTVGERTEERGYQDALIYINDGVEPGLGGGICQVSSTLYNATLEAELKQEMRECHQFTVFYVDLGMDATVAWGNIDYIFSNNTEYPIKIVSKAENGKLTMSILGTADYETKDISFRSEIVAVYPHHTNTTLNEALAPGVKDIKTHGRSGYQVNTYKTVTVDGEKRPEQWVDVSYYDPLDTVVIEGPPLETTAAVTTTTKATTTTATPPPTTAVTTVPPTSAGIITGTTQPPQTVATPSSPGGAPAEPPAA